MHPPVGIVEIGIDQRPRQPREQAGRGRQPSGLGDVKPLPEPAQSGHFLRRQFLDPRILDQGHDRHLKRLELPDFETGFGEVDMRPDMGERGAEQGLRLAAIAGQAGRHENDIAREGHPPRGFLSHARRRDTQRRCRAGNRREIGPQPALVIVEALLSAFVFECALRLGGLQGEIGASLVGIAPRQTQSGRDPVLERLFGQPPDKPLHVVEKGIHGLRRLRGNPRHQREPRGKFLRLVSLRDRVRRSADALRRAGRDPDRDMGHELCQGDRRPRPEFRRQSQRATLIGAGDRPPVSRAPQPLARPQPVGYLGRREGAADRARQVRGGFDIHAVRHRHRRPHRAHRAYPGHP